MKCRGPRARKFGGFWPASECPRPGHQGLSVLCPRAGHQQALRLGTSVDAWHMLHCHQTPLRTAGQVLHVAAECPACTLAPRVLVPLPVVPGARRAFRAPLPLESCCCRSRTSLKHPWLHIHAESHELKRDDDRPAAAGFVLGVTRTRSQAVAVQGPRPTSQRRRSLVLPADAERRDDRRHELHVDCLTCFKDTGPPRRLSLRPWSSHAAPAPSSGSRRRSTFCQL